MKATRSTARQIWGAVVIAAATGGLVYLESRGYPQALTVQATAHRVIQAADLNRDENFHNTVDAVRTFIHVNSVRRVDAEFYSYWGDNTEILERLLAHYKGNGPKPHLESSVRSGLMEILLRRLGYRTRSVVAYKPAPGFPSHTFLDVLNPESAHWESQDPDYDVYWRDRATGERIGARRIIMGSVEEVIPCKRPDRCGWTLV